MLNPRSIALTALIALTPTLAHADWLGSTLELLNGGATATPTSTAQSSLSNRDVIQGLKEALNVGADRVVTRLAKQDGFNGDASIHIPLPDNMKRVKSALGSIGMGSMMDDLELRLNRAAEAATPEAKRIFSDAIRAMTIDDARSILNGPDNAATEYFRGKMSNPLADAMRPHVDKALAEAGAVQAYDAVMGEYASLPFVPDIKTDLSSHVLDLGLKGIFHYMAAEEAAIRRDPVKRSSEILKKVFAN